MPKSDPRTAETSAGTEPPAGDRDRPSAVSVGVTTALAPALRLARRQAGGGVRARPRFETVVEAHLDGVYRYLRQLVRDPDLAEEITAATFEKAFRSWSRYDPRRAQPQTWLCSIARNLAIDHGRKERTRRGYEQRAAEPLEPATVDRPSVGLAPELASALAELTDAEREVLGLRVVLEMSCEEAAAVMGVTPSACSTQLHRVLTKLRGRVHDG